MRSVSVSSDAAEGMFVVSGRRGAKVAERDLQLPLRIQFRDSRPTDGFQQLEMVVVQRESI